MSLEIDKLSDNNENTKLGVLELCAALNGDDSEVALKCLRKFTATVRKERYLALFSHQYDVGQQDPSHGIIVDQSEDDKILDNMDTDSDDEENNDDELSPPKKKKSKIDEEWKLDVKSYNVPFVGTKVSKGDTGTVVTNEWPTGFLSAYLQKSPNAIELAGSTVFLPPSGAFQKPLIRAGRHKLSSNLYKAYLEALIELVTAEIPKNILVNIMRIQSEKLSSKSFSSLLLDDKTLSISSSDFNMESSHPMIISIMKERLSEILQTLSTQVSGHSYKGNNASRNDCGPLAPTIFNLLTNLSYTSIKISRQIARAMTSLKDGALNNTLRPSLKKTTKNLNTGDQKDKNNEETTKSTKIMFNKDHERTRRSCLSLATALIQTNDSQTLNIVMSPGSKHQKTCPGIIYVVFRVAMTERAINSYDPSEGDEDAKYLEAHQHFFKSLGLFLAYFRILIFPKQNEDSSFDVLKSDINHRLKVDLFGGDVLNRLTNLSTYSPSLSRKDELDSILSCVDQYTENDPLSSMQFSAVQCRRLLFSLLTDTIRSPFYSRSTQANRVESPGRNFMQKIVRSLISLSSPANMTLGMRSFILHCFSLTPELMPMFFNSISTVSDPKPTFECISSLAHLSFYIREGPTMLQCLVKENELTHTSLSNLKSKNDESLILTSIPKSLTKNTLSKSIQHPNPLVVFESMKLCISILHRSKIFLDSLITFSSDEKDENKEVLECILSRFMGALIHRLPDTQSLLAIRSKFEQSNKKTGKKSMHLILSMQIYEVLQLYKECLPQFFFSVKFEWTKLVPEKEMFDSIHPVLQYRSLKTLQSILTPSKFIMNGQNSLQDTQRFTAKFFITLISITISSNIKDVKEVARDIAMMIITNRADSKRIPVHIVDCLQHEAQLWVDHSSEPILPSLEKCFDNMQKNPIQHSVLAAQAWSHFFPSSSLPKLSFSPLLMSSFLYLITSTSHESIKDFATCLRSIFLKSILIQLNPLPLATILLYSMELLKENATKGNDSKNEIRTFLNDLFGEALEYSKFIVKVNSSMHSKVDKKEFYGSLKNLEPLLNNSSKVIVHKFLKSCSPNQGSQKEFIYDSAMPHMDSSNSIIPNLCQSLHHLLLLNKCSLEAEYDIASNDIQKMIRLTFIKAIQNPDRDLCISGLEAIFQTFEHSYSCYTGILLSLALSAPILSAELLKQCPSFQNYLKSTSANMIANMKKFKVEKKNPFSQEGSNAFIQISLICSMAKARFSIISQSSILENLLGICCVIDSADYTSGVKNFFFALLLEFIEEQQPALNSNAILNQEFFTNSCFHLWEILSERKNIRLHTLLSKLEKLITHILTNAESYGIGAYTIYTIIKSNPSKLMHCFVSSRELLPEASSLRNDISLLNALIAYDCKIFAGPILDVLSARPKSSKVELEIMEKAFAELIVRSKGTIFNESTCIHPQLHQLSIQISNQFLEDVKEFNGRPENILVWKLQVKCLHTLFGNQNVSIELKNNIILSFSSIVQYMLDKSMNKAGPEVDAILVMSLTSIARKGNIESKEIMKLRSNLFSWLCVILPKKLKREQKDYQHNKVKDDSFPAYLVLMCLINIINITIVTKTSFDEDIISGYSNQIVKAVISSLKIGISNICRDEVSSLCLRFVRVLVTTFSGLNSSLSKVLNAFQIHMMIATHSMFKSSLAKQESSDIKNNVFVENHKKSLLHFNIMDLTKLDLKDTKLELVYLLLCCVSVSDKYIDIDTYGMSSLIGAYNAGLSEFDRALRRLFYLYELNSTKHEKPSRNLFTDEVRWGIYENEHSPLVQGRDMNWEWFIENLSPERIRLTLSQFPFWESLNPLPLIEIERWYLSTDDDHDDNQHTEDDDKSKSSDSATSETGSKGNETRSENDVQKKVVNIIRRDYWQGEGTDGRYSPSFILPMILSMLLAFLPSEGLQRMSKISKMNELNDENDEIWKKNTETDEVMLDNEYESQNDQSVQCEVYVDICYRLCEKGGAALVLASLSCIDPCLRQISVAIIGLLLKGIYSKEAHEIDLWKQRPQIQMILDSIQRGLTLRRDGIKSKNKESSLSDVSRLPPVSAIFLAQASLIVSKVDHDMYSSINGFFLKLTENHGAYKDTGSLPAFISLFCSSSDRPDQLKKEKIWALSLLSEAVLDNFDYVVASRRHVPALLLTTFETTARRKEKSSSFEMESILKAIIILVRNGGRIAYSHFTQKVGLTSWIKGFLASVDVTKCLSTLSLRFYILRLVHEIMNCGVRYCEDTVSDKYLIAEARFLMRSVVDFFIETTHTTFYRKERDSMRSQFQSLFCKTMCSMQSVVLLSSKDGKEGVEIENRLASRGVNIKSIHALLEMPWANHKELVRLIGSLSSFSFFVNKSDMDMVALICASILKVLLATDFVEMSSNYERILKMIELMLEKDKDNVVGNAVLINLFLSLRFKSTVSNESIEIWKRCLEMLKNKT